MIRVYDNVGNVIETHEHKGDFKGGHPALKIAALNSNLLSAIYATPPMTGKKKRDAVIRVYDAAGNVIEAHEHKGEFANP